MKAALLIIDYINGIMSNVCNEIVSVDGFIAGVKHV